MIRIREMTVADIPFGMRLKEHAGWNQIEADWRRLLDLQPDGCYLAEWDGVPAGTVTTCRFGSVAWIAMMLVDEAYRRRGIGRTLMFHALDYLEAWGVHSVRLDASPMGRPLYESLGFKGETTIARYQGVLPSVAEEPALPEVEAGEVFDSLSALDRAVTGTERTRLLRTLVDEYPGSLRVSLEEGVVTGFVMSRPGSKARQIGPCIAEERAGASLLEDARRRYAGELVFLDIPSCHKAACGLASAWGLEPVRFLTRMGYGPRVVEDLDRLWVSAGAEKGGTSRPEKSR